MDCLVCMDWIDRNRLDCRSPRIAVRSLMLAVIVMIPVRLFSTKRHSNVIRESMILVVDRAMREVSYCHVGAKAPVKPLTCGSLKS